MKRCDTVLPKILFLSWLFSTTQFVLNMMPTTLSHHLYASRPAAKGFLNLLLIQVVPDWNHDFSTYRRKSGPRLWRCLICLSERACTRCFFRRTPSKSWWIIRWIVVCDTLSFPASCRWVFGLPPLTPFLTFAMRALFRTFGVPGFVSRFTAFFSPEDSNFFWWWCDERRFWWRWYFVPCGCLKFPVVNILRDQTSLSLQQLQASHGKAFLNRFAQNKSHWIEHT